MNTTLVILAAGLGSRYGGIKQMDGIGPKGEILMEYSIHDALKAGFNKVVFIIKPEMVEPMKALCGDRIARRAEVCYAVQDYSSVPAFYTVPAQREKPFGTVHALLCAREAVREPFIVINADDYYGPEAFSVIYQALGGLKEQGEGTMVAYHLKNTVSKNGSVTRGVCQGNGFLEKVTETYNITVMPDGSIRDMSAGDGTKLDGDLPVSMNFWGFTPWVFGQMEAYFHDFLKTLAPDELKKECLLPAFVDELIQKNRLTVSMLRSSSVWFGMTYHQDRQAVALELEKLHRAGVYPPTLRG